MGDHDLARSAWEHGRGPASRTIANKNAKCVRKRLKLGNPRGKEPTQGGDPLSPSNIDDVWNGQTRTVTGTPGIPNSGPTKGPARLEKRAVFARGTGDCSARVLALG